MDTAERRAEARRLYLDGLSERAVAKQLGISRRTVHDYLVDAGVERRRVGAPQGNRHAAAENRKRARERTGDA